MKSPKKWKSFEEQLDLLLERGLVVNDKRLALSYLERIGYYRLSGYFHLFRKKDVRGNKLDCFTPNSSFQEALNLYVFDKRLRLLALDALERIEIAIKVDVAYLLGNKESLAHTNRVRFDNKFQHQKWMDKYDDLMSQSDKLDFVIHHNQHYNGKLPIWVASEVWNFGALSKLYAGMKLKDKDKISRKYRLPSGKNLETQLHAFNVIRNISAHHGRLWNRGIIRRVSIKGITDPIDLQKLSPNHMFMYFCLMKRMLDIICPRSTWGERFSMLIDEFPTPNSGAFTIEQFGLPKGVDFKSWNLWKPK